MLVHILPYGILSNHFLPPKRQSSPRRSLMRAAFCFCRSPDAHLTQRSRGHEHTFVNSSPWFTVLTRAYKATRFVVISSLPLSVIMPAPIPHPSALGRDPKRNGARRLRRSQTTERPAGCSSIHCLPREVRGQNKKTVPSLRTSTSGVFGTSCDELLMDACSFGRTRIR